MNHNRVSSLKYHCNKSWVFWILLYYMTVRVSHLYHVGALNSRIALFGSIRNSLKRRNLLQYQRNLKISQNFILVQMSSFHSSVGGNDASNLDKNDTSINDIKSVVSNANSVKERIHIAATRCGRNPEDINLVAVSKTKPVEAINDLYNAGYKYFGENYFQELLEKAESLPDGIKWRFIGHLQSQKASRLVKEVKNLDCVETVDSIKLATKLNNACESHGKNELNIFIQVDTSGEDTKSGVDIQNLLELSVFVRDNCPRLKLKGLMTIGSPGDISCFDRLVEARNKLAIFLSVEVTSLELSMGMSGDFEEAIARGSTSVRVGSTIFGAREYKKD